MKATDPKTAAEYQEYLKGKTRKVSANWQTPKLTESQQQAECVDWFRSNYPQFEKLLYSVPNGGFRNKRTAAILKREGAISGVPDLTLAIPSKSYHGLYLELKIKGNKPTANQLEMMDLLSQQGYRCEVIYTTEEFKEVINNYLNAA